MNVEEVPHPSVLIPAGLTEEIRGLAPEAEKAGRLHPQQLSIIYERKWFNLYVPEEYGGLALSLPEGLKIQEGLAWADGSTGWTVTLCSGANWFAGFMRQEIAESLFKDPKVCLAGSGRPSGIAKRSKDGYTITGSWDHASGAPHATAFTANCVIADAEGATVDSTDGRPLVRAFVLLKEEVVLEESWRVLGMIATASHGFQVKQLEVAEDRCFTIDGSHAVLSQPIYQYPFLQLAETTLAVNSSGMAARFIELGERMVIEKSANKSRKAGSKEIGTGSENGNLLLLQTGEAKNKLQDLREAFYTAVRLSWEAVLLNRPIPAALLKEVSRTSRELAAGARRLVDELYPLCGLIAADPATEINRVWRNLHTASQHSLLAYPGGANS
jgi:alkylation response protein AidB-like acyl-CoA dehydrogenase